MKKIRIVIIFAVVAVLVAMGIIGFMKYREIQAEKDALAKETETESETEIETESETETETETETEPETEFKNGWKVAIDPGHQGWHVDMSALEPSAPGSTTMKAKATTGTAGRYTGVAEFQLNLDISLALRDELENRGYEVVMTREDNDTAISNMERALLAADEGCDILIRVHANGSEDSSVNGAMTMVPSASNPYVGYMADECHDLGEAVINAYCAETGMKNNGVQIFDNMTGINWSSIPVTIIEMGFMTNETDDTNMQKTEYQAKMVLGIANGIDEYFANKTPAKETEAESEAVKETESKDAQKDTEAKTGNTTGGDLSSIISNCISSSTYSGETWSVAVMSCDGSNNTTFNERQMQAASLIKLYIMGAVYENYTTLTNTYGQSTVDNHLYNMITISDNDAANSLTKMLGGGDAAAGRGVVNSFCTSHGYSNSSMGRMLLEANPSGENYTSAGDCAEFLQDAYNGTLSYSSSMISLLKQQQRTGKIPAGVPSGVTTANKTGELSNVENDAAIIYAGGDYILCVMSGNLYSTSNARSVITKISSQVYDYFQ